MSNQISEEAPDKKKDGTEGSPEQSSEKKIRQAVYDIRYRARREELDVRHAFSQYVGNSGLSQQERSAVKDKLFGKDGGGAGDQAESLAIESVSNAMFKVFESSENTKYKIRVTDKEKGSSYVRYGDRNKITQLRGNPNISSVEMTGHGDPYEGDKSKKGEKTPNIKKSKGKDAEAKGKDHNIDLKKEAYEVTNADKKGNTPAYQGYKAGKKNVKTGEPLYKAADHLKKEEFIADAAAVPPPSSKKITGEKVDNRKLIKVYPQDKSDPQIGNIKSSKETDGPVILEIVRRLREGKEKGLDGKACWKGYKLAGTKKKGGKTVDNCVKVKEEKRWQDDDGDGKWYEKSDVDGKISKKEKKSHKHNCASKVKHEEFGIGNPVKGMHDLDENGVVQHYDVFFEHGIEKNVSVSSLEILEGSMHEHVIREGKGEKNCGCGQDPCITYGKNKNAHKMPDGTVMPGKTHKEEEDPRSMATKWNLVKNKLRSMGLNMSHEPEGDTIEESEAVAQGARKRAQELGAARRKREGVNRGVDKNERAGYKLSQAASSSGSSLETQRTKKKRPAGDDTSQIGHYKNRDAKRTTSKTGKPLKKPVNKLSLSQRVDHHSNKALNRRDPKQNPKHTANEHHQKDADGNTIPHEQINEVAPLIAAAGKVAVAGAKKAVVGAVKAKAKQAVTQKATQAAGAVADRVQKPIGAVESYKSESNVVRDILELNRFEKETGTSSGSLNMPKGKPTQKGGTASPVMRAVRTSIRKETGKPQGQEKKVKGAKPPVAGEYGARKSPEQIVQKRRSDKAAATAAMSDTRGT